MELFSSVVGQDRAKRILTQGIISGNLPQTLVFVGPRGAGKRTVARLLAEYLHQSSNPAHVDTFGFETVLEDKRMRNTAVPMKETTSEMIRFLQMSPMISKFKVAIVEQAGQLSEESQSGLLKALEEPWSDRVVVLIVEKLEELLPTILSRAQVVRFVALADSLVAQVVGESVNSRIVQLAGGSIGRAWDLKKNSEVMSQMDRILDFWNKLKDKDLESRLAWSEEMKDRDKAIQFLEEGLRLAHGGVTGAMVMTVEQIEEIERTLGKVRDNANVRLALDAMMLSV